MVSLYTKLCLTSSSGINICCMNLKTDQYRLVESYPKSSTYKVEYCGKDVTFNVLACAAENCNFDFDYDRKGGKTFLYVHFLSEPLLRKTIFIIKKAIALSRSQALFSQIKKVVIFSRKNGIACMKWWKEKNARPEIYSIGQGNRKDINFSNMDKALLQKECFINKGDIVRMQITPQINIQQLPGGDNIYHLQFLLTGHIVRGNDMPQFVEVPLPFESDEDPLSFMK